MALTTAIALNGSGVVATPTPAATASRHCPAGFTREIGIGCTKQLTNGHRLVHHASGIQSETHGGDHGVADGDEGQALAAIAVERPVVCAPSGSRSRAIYAYAAGSTNDLEKARSQIQAAVRAANGLLAQEAAETGVVADYRFACDADGQPQVSAISTTGADYSLIVDAVRIAGFKAPQEDYWIFADVESPGGYAGIGTRYLDDNLSVNNANYRNAGYGITYRGFWGGRTPMHEHGHNMGAVQDSAPDSSGAGHCDGNRSDLMCYDDGGPAWDPTHECGTVSGLHYDACHNDYFHTSPTPGSYLATKHNIGANRTWASFDNPFLAFGAATSGAGGYAALSPSRILDTRAGNGAPAARMGPGATLGLQVTGRGGVPSAGVSAVVVNVTVTEPSAASYLTAWPAGVALPTASNLNFTAGQTVPNLVVVKVGTNGVVNLYNAIGETHVIADVVGWYSPWQAGGL